MTSAYVTAVVALLQAGRPVDEVLANLARLLAHRGHTRLHRAILAAVVAKLRVPTGAPLVKVSRASDATSPLVASLLQSLGARDTAPRVSVDDTLIGGAIVRVGHTEIDASDKTRLRQLYHAVITK